MCSFAVPKEPDRPAISVNGGLAKPRAPFSHCGPPLVQPFVRPHSPFNTLIDEPDRLLLMRCWHPSRVTATACRPAPSWVPPWQQLVLLCHTSSDRCFPTPAHFRLII